jgi:hypothetical protein
VRGVADGAWRPPGSYLSFNLGPCTVAPSTKVLSYTGKSPAIHESSFIAPSASVIGQVGTKRGYQAAYQDSWLCALTKPHRMLVSCQVTVAKGSSVWYGATLRGEARHVHV